ncbi:hypothetical protein GIB67_010890 [Kingdonia uniflora]|uniref:HMA domain-containing protein n=1 Tax=Kingdonia uniflora TaxID=39325 RepID=A0A7J7M4N4_9MAGN|nr:hypothetical protein GIB67_010890 [Kingdonia uniflora]
MKTRYQKKIEEKEVCVGEKYQGLKRMYFGRGDMGAPLPNMVELYREELARREKEEAEGVHILVDHVPAVPAECDEALLRAAVIGRETGGGRGWVSEACYQREEYSKVVGGVHTWTIVGIMRTSGASRMRLIDEDEDKINELSTSGRGEASSDVKELQIITDVPLTAVDPNISLVRRSWRRARVVGESNEEEEDEERGEEAGVKHSGNVRDEGEEEESKSSEETEDEDTCVGEASPQEKARQERFMAKHQLEGKGIILVSLGSKHEWDKDIVVVKGYYEYADGEVDFALVNRMYKAKPTNRGQKNPRFYIDYLINKSEDRVNKVFRKLKILRKIRKKVDTLLKEVSTAAGSSKRRKEVGPSERVSDMDYNNQTRKSSFMPRTHRGVLVLIRFVLIWRGRDWRWSSDVMRRWQYWRRRWQGKRCNWYNPKTFKLYPPEEEDPTFEDVVNAEGTEMNPVVKVTGVENMEAAPVRENLDVEEMFMPVENPVRIIVASYSDIQWRCTPFGDFWRKLPLRMVYRRQFSNNDRFAFGSSVTVELLKYAMKGKFTTLFDPLPLTSGVAIVDVINFNHVWTWKICSSAGLAFRAGWGLRGMEVGRHLVNEELWADCVIQSTPRVWGMVRADANGGMDFLVGLLLGELLVFQILGVYKSFFRGMFQQTVVLKVSMNDAKSRTKAIKVAVSLPGIEKTELQSENNQIVITGEGIDTMKLIMLIRKKVGFTELVSVTPIVEKKEEKKEITESVPVIWTPPYPQYFPQNYVYDVRSTSNNDPCRMM